MSAHPAVRPLLSPLQGVARPSLADDRIPEIPGPRAGRGIWGFQPTDAAWADHLSCFAAFCREVGHRPRARATDPAERRLARWIGTQRQDLRALVLPEVRRVLLDEHVPGWSD